MLLVVGAEHRWARRSAVRVRELLPEPYLTREAASGTRAVATAAIAQAGLEADTGNAGQQPTEPQTSPQRRRVHADIGTHD
ncbi:MAG: hypothetical protein DLM64_12365 [Solirubrobacterales bacterium]|nr:MAG: hypothetical protein DLM64_12365 [Solirubrobacterales bacterium]